MYRRIIVPLDGSVFSAAAIPFAAEVAARARAMIELVRIHIPEPIDDHAIYTVCPLEGGGGSDPYTRLEPASLRTDAEELSELGQVVANEIGLSVTARVVCGDFDESIDELAETLHADLIVMATHARSGVDRFRSGSVAESVVRIAKKPVLLVQPSRATKGGAHHPWFRRVLIPLDGSRFSEEVLPAAGDLARLFGASVFVLHVETSEVDGAPPATASAGDGSSTSMGDWQSRVRRSPWLPSRTRFETVVADDVASAIAAIAERDAMDVIAMATHGRGGPSLTITGSTAFDVLHQTRLPLLLRRPFRAWSEASFLTEEDL